MSITIHSIFYHVLGKTQWTSNSYETFRSSDYLMYSKLMYSNDDTQSQIIQASSLYASDTSSLTLSNTGVDRIKVVQLLQNLRNHKSNTSAVHQDNSMRS